MMHDTEELIITQYESGDGTKLIQTKKTVTRRRPDLLYKNENGEKVPKYVHVSCIASCLSLYDVFEALDVSQSVRTNTFLPSTFGFIQYKTVLILME